MKGTEVAETDFATNSIPHPDMVGVSGHLEWLVVDDLQVDQRYQRDLSEVQVRKIVKDFDPDAFGVITVSSRGSGGMFVVDGQHRLAALRHMGWGAQRVPCIVYRSLTLEDEAKVFYLPQTTRKYMTPAQKFRARLIAGEPNAIAIKEMVESFGYSLNLGNGSSHYARDIDSVAMVERITRQYGFDHLPLTLGIVRDAWGNTDIKISGAVLGGISVFTYRYKCMYDRSRLVRLLQELNSRSASVSTFATRKGPSFKEASCLPHITRSLIAIPFHGRRFAVGPLAPCRPCQAPPGTTRC